MSSAERLDPAEFRSPGPEYRGVTLWFLNDRLEESEVERQLRGFRDAGWGAIIARAFMGVRTPYLSPEWIRFSNRAIDEAKKLGLRVMLQHADKNAAPYMVSGVPGMEERFRHQLVIAAPVSDPAPERSELLHTDADKAYYRLVVAPTGDWARLMAVLDLLDDDTMDAYLAAAYKPLAKHHGHEFGKTVEAIWVDEPWLRISRYTPHPSLPWTTDLAERFAQQWGYDLLSHLPDLFAPVGDYQRVRHHYWRTVNRRYLETYWKKVYDWCNAHDTQFSGHLMGEDTLNGQIGWTGTVMPSYEYMHIPGIDHLTKNVKSWPAGTPFIGTPKQCSSAANQFGRREVLAEMYGVSDSALSFADRKWLAEWMAVMGINYRCYHGSFYTLRGKRKRFYPPYLSEQQPWWTDNRLVADPMARLSYVLRQGQFAGDILMLHPLESAHGEFDPARTAPAVQKLQASWAALSERLMTLHRAYDYGDEEIMSRHGSVADGRLLVGEMAYRTVILPDIATLRASTVQLLTGLLDAGGSVIATGVIPTRIDGVEDAALAALTDRFFTADPETNLESVLDHCHAPDLRLTGAGAEGIWLHPRRVGNTRIVFLFNTDRDHGADVELALRGSGRLDAWGLESADSSPIPQECKDGWVVAPLHVAPGGSHLLVLDETASPVAIPAPQTSESQSISLPKTFTVTRHDPNALVLDFCRYRCGDGDWSEPLPVIGLHEKLVAQNYCGPLELSFSFRSEVEPASCALVIEDSEQCSVTLNGHTLQRAGDAFYRDRGFHRLDATGRVVVGENEVRIVRDFVAADASAVSHPERFYGTELESAYFIGDFAVQQKGTEFVLTAETGECGTDLLADYPFYAGRLTLSATLDLPKPQADEQVVLELGPLQAILAKVAVNGNEVGAITWAPYEVDITSSIQAGGNRIEIELVNSLRNLIGPHHRSTPSPFEVWDRHFTAKSERADWMDRPQRGELQHWTDEYCLVPLGIDEGARIVYRSTEQ